MSTTHPHSPVDAAGSPGTIHPLEPLSAHEIAAAVAILRSERELAETVRFSTVELAEPGKPQVLGWPHAGPVERQAFIIVMDRANGAVHEAVVSLDTEEVVS